MNNLNWLRDSYKNFLKVKSKESEIKIDRLLKEERLDESNLEKIRLNVIEIFTKMFDISYSDNPVDLREKYLGFFKKITGPWHINKEKADVYGEVREMVIEEIKIQEAEILRRQFIKFYSKIDIN